MLKLETCQVRAGLGLLLERVLKGAAMEREERRAAERMVVSCIVVVYMYRVQYIELNIIEKDRRDYAVVLKKKEEKKKTYKNTPRKALLDFLVWAIC